VHVPIYATILTGAVPDSLFLLAELRGFNAIGQAKVFGVYQLPIKSHPWMSEALPPLSITMPDEPAVAILAVQLIDRSGTVLQRNFAAFVVEAQTPDLISLDDCDICSGEGDHPARLVHVPATQVSDSHWSLKQWTVLGDKKLNGAGSGFFEYRLPWPSDLKVTDVAGATFLVEASAKRLNGKDRDSTINDNGDYMRGGGFHDRSRNPNSYPMTSAYPYPSAVTVRINGALAGRFELNDDPADSRGILSWYSQPQDGHLYEAGSYGQLLRVPLPVEAVAAAARTGSIVVRLEVDDALPGGLAIYGARFGRYPVDPSVLILLK
jgi:hypothetical protein